MRKIPKHAIPGIVILVSLMSSIALSLGQSLNITDVPVFQFILGFGWEAISMAAGWYLGSILIFSVKTTRRDLAMKVRALI